MIHVAHQVDAVLPRHLGEPLHAIVILNRDLFSSLGLLTNLAAPELVLFALDLLLDDFTVTVVAHIVVNDWVFVHVRIFRIALLIVLGLEHDILVEVAVRLEAQFAESLNFLILLDFSVVSRVHERIMRGDAELARINFMDVQTLLFLLIFLGCLKFL